MKKLTKLGISPEKIMKNEELINLQGGYAGGGGSGSCICWSHSHGSYGYMYAGGEMECWNNCEAAFGPGSSANDYGIIGIWSG